MQTAEQRNLRQRSGQHATASLSRGTAMANRRKRTDEKLDLSELISAPNLGGMLSFLEVSPDEALRRQDLRRKVEAATAATPYKNPVSTPDPIVAMSVAERKPYTSQTEEDGPGGIPSLGDATSPGDATTPDLPKAVYELENVPSTDPVLPTNIAIQRGPATPDSQLDTPTPPTSLTSRSVAASPGDDTVGGSQKSLVRGETALVGPRPPSEGQLRKSFPLNPSGSRHSQLISYSSPANGTRRLIHRCQLAQDGHSHIEQEIYDVLWRNGVDDDSATGSRITRIGRSKISRQARVTERNLIIILRRLIQKQALEIVGRESSDTNTPRTYRVFSFIEILKRRRAAKLEWVVRGRGVEFVDPETGNPIFDDEKKRRTDRGSIAVTSPRDAVSPSSDLTSPGPSDLMSPGPSDVTSRGTGDATSPKPSDVTSSLLEKDFRKETSSRQSSSSSQTKANTSSSDLPPTEFVKGITQLISFIDDEALNSIWQECRLRVPDCTVEEVLHFTQMKAVIASNPKIENPVGFLIAAVPKCFGTGFSQFREAESRRQAEERLREEQRRAEEAEILRELEAYKRAKEKLDSLPQEKFESLFETTKAKLLERYPAARHWSPQGIEETVRSRMLEIIQEEQKVAG